MPKLKLIPIGARFGRLVVIGDPIRNQHRIVQYPCQCDCGQQSIPNGTQLTNGGATSCGCKRKETMSRIMTTHGESKTKLYTRWVAMKARCENPNNISYRYYGGKGIKVCKAFQRYESFKAWAIKAGYRNGLTIERRKSNGNYTPKNCCWADWKTQNRNSGKAHKLNFRGRTLCLTEWAEITGIKAKTIGRRLGFGWPVWRVLTEKVKLGRHYS